jgi:hypothetical protein
MVVGIASLFALGSALDVDLDREIQGGLQGLLEEEAPLAPVRLLLTGMGGALFALHLVILAALSAAAAVALLLALDALLLAAGVPLASARLGARRPAR